MSNIVEFDQEALKKRVSESVQSQFGKLIPDDAWEKMVEKELKAFFEEETNWTFKSDRYNDDQLNVKVTPFRQMIWQEVHKKCHSKIREVLDGEKFTSFVDKQYVSGGFEATSSVALSEYFEKVIEDQAPKMIQAFFGNFAAAIVDAAKNEVFTQLNNQRNNNYY